MFRPLPPALRGVLVFLCIVLSTLVQFPFLLLLALLKLAIPWRPSRLFFTRGVNAIAWNWIHINGILLEQAGNLKWQIRGGDKLRKDSWYLVTCNHRSWADILILQKVLADKIPFLKFFLKQELIWVPFIGVAWWALDFPFMKRYTRSEIEKNPALKGKDLETTRKACEKFKDIPVSIFNFMEGTRFTPEKYERQNSPYRHLLKPKAGGTAFVLGAMGQRIDTLIDITIYYPYPDPGFWDLLCGQIREVVIEIETLQIPQNLLGKDYMSDPVFRAEIQQWITAIWKQKDQRLDELQQQLPKRSQP